jgi:hypothetical protein
VQELEALLRKSHRLALASGLWSRYMRGEVVPQGALTASPTSLVARIAKVFPDTNEVFYTPLWDLLTWKPELDLNGLKSTYLALDEGVHVHFVARVGSAGERTAAKNGQFWHLKKTVANRRSVISGLGKWIGLVVYLLEARMSYAAQSIEAFVDCQLSACQILVDLSQEPQLQAKRLQGVMLLMEALCLDALLINVVAPQPTNENQRKERDRCRAAMKDWRHRCGLHVASLSMNSRLAFLRAMRDGTLIGREQSNGTAS